MFLMAALELLHLFSDNLKDLLFPSQQQITEAGQNESVQKDKNRQQYHREQ
jgi:hypothetical protein